MSLVLPDAHEDCPHPSRIHARVPNDAHAREATAVAPRRASAKPSGVRESRAARWWVRDAR